LSRRRQEGVGKERGAGRPRKRPDLRAGSGIATERGGRNEVGLYMRGRLGAAGLGLLVAALRLGGAGAGRGRGGCVGVWRAPVRLAAPAAVGVPEPVALEAQPPPVPAAPDARFAGLQW